MSGTVVTIHVRTHCTSFWLEFLWSERSSVPPLHAHRLSCGLWIMPHLINDHSMPQKFITLHLVPLQEFLWYSHAILLWYVSQCGTQWELAFWYTGYHTITLNIITHIFNSTNREQMVGRPVHTYSILDSCNILHIIDTLILSWSWNICCSLPAHSKQTEPVQHHCLWYTCGTIYSRITSCHSEKWNQCPLILVGKIHQVVHNISAVL